MKTLRSCRNPRGSLVWPGNRVFAPLPVFAALLVASCALSSYAQQSATQQAAPFGCEDGAVDTDIDRQPAMKFVPIEQLPVDAYDDASRKFDVNYDGHKTTVQFLLSATMSEQPVGRASTATLTVFAITSPANSDWTKQRNWQLVSTATGNKVKTSNSFTFDARTIGACFNPDDNASCKFADIGWATQNGTPIFDLSFTEDGGGANANNWSTTDILLDFRTLPPRVLASADCGYNEGGGACTAIDSGQAQRSGIGCAWDSDKKDFSCTERMSDPTAYRDFFLLSDARPPMRKDEVGTMADAVAKLMSDDKAKVSVRGIGRMHLITRVQKSPDSIVFVLSVADIEGGVRFFLVPEINRNLQPPLALIPRPVFSQNKQVSTGDLVQRNKEEWTVDKEISITSKTLYDDESLIILQVVTGSTSTQRAVYWIGISKTGAVNDAVVVSGDNAPEYLGCGRFLTSPSMVRTVRTYKPFKVSVQVQPRTIVSDSDQPITWDTGENGEPIQNCLRNGEIRWTGNGFTGSINVKPCGKFLAPRFLKINEAGNVTLSNEQTP